MQQQNRARRADDQVGAPLLRSHQHRLQALWDLSLGEDFSADNQLRALLGDAAIALQSEYAELYCIDDRTYVASGSPDAASVLELSNYAAEYALGAATTDVATMLLIGDTDSDSIWGVHPLVTAIPLRSVLIVPIAHGGKRRTLLFAWKEQRDGQLTEEESRYVTFFQRILLRLLDNLEREREISSQITTDHLTGLHNRAATLEAIGAAVSAADRSGAALAVLYVDLDGFKDLNDNYGHAFGDAALQQAATRMRAVLRKHEIAGRIGGDEFALLVTSFADENQLARIAKRVLAALREPITSEGAKARLTASVGIAVYPQHGTTPEQLMAHADQAMYHAKRSAGDGYAFFGSPAETTQPVRHLFAAQLANAVLEHEFFLCYQPIVNARTGRATGAEALIRWLHPGMGMLTPQSFLDTSRDHHILSRIESWVVASALEKQGKMRTVGRRLTIHVNVSEPNDELFDFSNDSLADLHVEISEDAVAADEKAFVRFIKMASERGVRMGLSNFGAGRLSLSVLADLPLHFVKVGPRVTAPVVETAHRFGWSVIAENLEEPWQREWLIALGVDALQGYHIASPLAETDFDSWLSYQKL